MGEELRNVRFDKPKMVGLRGKLCQRREEFVGQEGEKLKLK